VIYLGPKEEKDNWLDELNSLGIVTEPGILVEQANYLAQLNNGHQKFGPAMTKDIFMFKMSRQCLYLK